MGERLQGEHMFLVGCDWNLDPILVDASENLPLPAKSVYDRLFLGELGPCEGHRWGPSGP
eukprot:754552-Pyramimonas_sp.AAC.1